MTTLRTQTRQRHWAYVGLVLTALFWAGNAVLARAVAAEIRPITLSFWRWLSALLVLLPVGLPHLRRNRQIVLGNLLPLVVLGLLSVAVYNTLLYLAAHTTSALNITLVNSTMPIAIAVLARFILRQKVTWGQVAGFFAAGFGMLTIVSHGDWRVLTSFQWNQGDLVMVLAVVIWGLYSVLLRVWAIDLAPIGLLTCTVAVGVVLLLPAFLWETATHGHFVWRPVHLPMMVFLAIFPSVLSFLFWNRGVTILGPSVTGMFIYLVPVFTAVLAYLLLGEELHGYHAVGGAAILAGLWGAVARTRETTVNG